ncbi:surf-like protein [Xanthoria parietina]
MSLGNHVIRCTRLNVASSHRRTTSRALRNPQFPRRNWAGFGVRRFAHSPADGADFTSIVDNSPDLVKSGKRHGPGIIILALIPITAFALGTWQVFRLGWKTELIARFEDRLIKPPLPLPPRIDPEAIKDFDYRKVYTTGHLCHEQEMLIGPRIHDGNDGFLVVTPLKRGDGGSTVLVNRGWIPRNKKAQADRGDGLPQGLVTVEGLLREPWQKNMFTPNNRPDLGQFYFPDVKQMAELTGSEAVWIEETMSPDLLKAYDREAKGVPIGRPAEVNLRNNHSQYIFTWYALSAATTIMLWMVVRKPPSEVARRIRQNKNW